MEIEYMSYRLNPKDVVGKEFYVRLRHFDNSVEYDSLRIIMALDREDAMEQVRNYANREGMYWYAVDIPSPEELKEIGRKFNAEWEEYYRKLEEKKRREGK